MPAIDFPSTPSVNDTVTFGDRTWVWDGTTWNLETSTITLTGDVTSSGNVTTIASGVIVNADVNASADIVDTKLATIGTAGKVSNSATTATAANTASAIVARDSNGYFTASRVTSNLFLLNAPVTKTGDFSVGTAENWLINNKASSSCVVTLPTASSFTGRQLTITNYKAFTVVSASSNVVPIIGGSAATGILAALIGEWATLVSDGTNWIIMQSNKPTVWG